MKIMTLVGTRPDTIKLAPVLFELKSRKNIESVLCASGQHKEMLQQALDIFEIKPDINLEVMSKNQTLVSLTNKLIGSISETLEINKPEILIVHGDTTTAFCAALAAFYRQIPVVHIEAGLRTYNINEPFPEEFNRQAISRIADLNFAPTENAKNNLLNEGILKHKIVVSGNTIVEALTIMRDRLKNNNVISNNTNLSLRKILDFDYLLENFILITMHRRENIGSGIISICEAIIELSKKFPKMRFVLPVHLNPSVSVDVKNLLSGYGNIKLVTPLAYVEFVALLSEAKLIITDSGGIQEESVSLGKYTLVTRQSTERQEGVDTGLLEVVDTETKKIVESASKILANPKPDQIPKVNPYGSGYISKQIVDKILEYYFI
jgi:UDP-N-acetylglucosamine 2-epimerase (non-hydrolysing)